MNVTVTDEAREMIKAKGGAAAVDLISCST